MGASLSFTVTVKVEVVLLPEASVAVTVTVVVPTGNVLPEAGSATTVTEPELSVAVGRVNVTAAPQVPASIVADTAGASATTGASTSVTVTVKVEDELLPEASVAVQVTVLTPMAKSLPEAGVQTTVTPGQLSLAAGAVKETVAVALPASVLTLMSAFLPMTGASVSFTVTVKVEVEVLPEASVAVEVTVVTPIGKVLPEAGLDTTLTPGQLSDAAGAAKVTTAPHTPASLETATGARVWIVGASTSTTVTDPGAVEVRPKGLVTVRVTEVTPLE